METQEELYRRKVELKNRRLLGEGNSRLRVLCPRGDKLKSDCAVDTSKTETEDGEVDLPSGVKGTRTGTYDNSQTFLGFLNSDASKTKRVASSIIGVTLFCLHNYMPNNTNIYGYYLANSSGIVSFVIFQVLVTQLFFIKYFRANSTTGRKDKTRLHYISKSYNPGKTGYINLISDVLEINIALKNIVSEWFMLLSSYVVMDLVAKLMIYMNLIALQNTI